MKKMENNKNNNKREGNQKEAGKGLSSHNNKRKTKMVTATTTTGDDSTTNRRRANSNSKFFNDGEKVLAYHGPRIYEAKVQKSEIRKNEWKYFVHYLGWSKTWDEWVTADRLMKTTEENIQKQKALDKKQGVDKNPKSGRSNQTKPKISNDIKVEKEDIKSNVVVGAKGKKRKIDSSAEKETASVEKVGDIQIPQTLKQLLVDDWEFINEQDKFVKLPCSPNVDEILKEYLEYRSKKDDMMADSDKEILNGLRCYFDRALSIILLYNKERKQYCEFVKKDVSPSCVYGAEHLLRLFVKLPELLRYIHVEEDVMTCLQEKFHDFLKFLEKKHSSFFVSSYDGSIDSED